MLISVYTNDSQHICPLSVKLREDPQRNPVGLLFFPQTTGQLWKMQFPFDIPTCPNGKKEDGESSLLLAFRRKKNEIGLSGLEGLGELS